MAIEMTKITSDYDKQKEKIASRIVGCSIKIEDEQVIVRIPQNKNVSMIDYKELVFSKNEIKHLVEELLIS